MRRGAYGHDYTWAIVTIVAAAALVAIFATINAFGPNEFSLDIDGNRLGAATETSSSMPPPPYTQEELRMGETQTYTFAGVEYEVTLLFVSEQEPGVPEYAIFSVNGVLSSPLSNGDSYEFGGAAITLKEMTVLNCEAIDCPYYYASFAIEPSDAPPDKTIPAYVLIADDLREGEMKTYTLNGIDYEITTVYVTDAEELPKKESRFMVNGELSPFLSEEEGYILGARLYLQQKNILVDERESIANFWIMDRWYAQSCENDFTGENVFTAQGEISVCCGGELKTLPVCDEAEPEQLECGDRIISCKDDTLISEMKNPHLEGDA